MAYFYVMISKDKIVVNGHFLNVSVNCSIFKSDKYFIGLIPSLKITSKSAVSEQDALKQMETILLKYFSFYTQSEVVFQTELSRLGWVEMSPPVNVSVPFDMLLANPKFKKIDFTMEMVA